MKTALVFGFDLGRRAKDKDWSFLITFSHEDESLFIVFNSHRCDKDKKDKKEAEDESGRVADQEDVHGARPHREPAIGYFIVCGSFRNELHQLCELSV